LPEEQEWVGRERGEGLGEVQPAFEIVLFKSVRPTRQGPWSAAEQTKVEALDQVSWFMVMIRPAWRSAHHSR
jgi:hypothetical protein